MKLNFASYNIRLGKQQGLEAIANVLRDADADFIALQEVGKFWGMGPKGDSTKELAKLLGYEFSFFIPAIDWGEEGKYGTAILTRLKVESLTIVELPMDVDEPRMVAHFEIKIDDVLVNVLTTHLSWIEDRPAQIESLIQMIETNEGITFLLGDLNEEEAGLKDAGLFDLLKDADPQNIPTFPANDPTRRIDYICANKGSFRWVKVHPNSEASDHLMVYCEWTLKI